MLVAIVGLRVEVLKLGSGVGRELQQASALESSNQLLRSKVSALSDNQRIIEKATQMGMLVAGPTAVHFVRAEVGTHVSAAIANIHAPSTDSFLSGLASERQADAASPAATETAPADTASTGETVATDSTSSDPASTGSVSSGEGSTPATDPGVSTGETSVASTDTAATDPSGQTTAGTAGGDTSDGTSADTSDAGASDTSPPATAETPSVPAATQSAGTAVDTQGVAGTTTGSTTGGSGLAG